MSDKTTKTTTTPPPASQTPLYARLCWEYDLTHDLEPRPLGLIRGPWVWDEEEDDLIDPWTDEHGWIRTPGRSPMYGDL